MNTLARFPWRRPLLFLLPTINAIKSSPFYFSSLSLPPVPPDPNRALPNGANPNDDPPKDDHFSTLSSILNDPNVSPGPTLHSALDRTGIRPDPALISSLFRHLDSSPKLLHSLFLWAQERPNFQPTPSLFNSAVNALCKSKEFDSTWCLVLDRINRPEPGLVSIDTFAILIRRYSRAGMTRPAVRTFEYASNLEFIRTSGSVTTLFEILLDALCKEGHVKFATEYFNKREELDPSWVPSVRVYNILLNGWFRSRKLKHAERLWLRMKNEGRDLVAPDVVTYGTLVEGYCSMRRVERAIELVFEMRKEGIQPNSIVYNPIIDALADAGRFKEVSGMMERFLLCESGPNISTYNSLVKGYCKAEDVAGASKVLKMMISREIYPTTRTYNYFFKCYSKLGKVEDAMNLYSKMIDSGYASDRLTYHLLVKMLCEDERLEVAVQVSREMRDRGFDWDLATGTMLIHLHCKMERFEEAFFMFEDMFRRGVVPQYLTFCRLNEELKKCRMFRMARKLCYMMASMPHSTGLPNTYRGEDGASQRARRKSILRKAEVMSEMLKTSNDHGQLIKHRRSTEDPVSNANRLMREIERRVNELSEL